MRERGAVRHARAAEGRSLHERAGPAAYTRAGRVTRPVRDGVGTADLIDTEPGGPEHLQMAVAVRHPPLAQAADAVEGGERTSARAQTRREVDLLGGQERAAADTTDRL